MEFTRLFTDERGNTRFESARLASDVPGATLPVPMSTMTIRSSAHMTTGEDLHPCPRRQFVLVLSAGMEIETSLGERRLFRPGDILLVEDLTGKGHRLHHVGSEEINIMLLPVPDGSPAYQPVAATAAAGRPGSGR